jgi:hypothetical protein
MVVTTVAFDQELHRRLAHAALDEGAALTELVRQAVVQFLDEREKRLRRRTK